MAGRLPVATGLKVARPDLTVVAAGGDGDGYSIGGNHFLHACRRNVDLTYIVMDNHVYGMTKGQASPTTEPDWDNALAPGGTGLRPFNPLVIALASGANFVARAFSGDVVGTADIIAKAIASPGFSFVEILSPCITFRPEQRNWKESVRPAPVATTHDPGRSGTVDHDRRRLQHRRALLRKPQAVSAADRAAAQEAVRTRTGIRIMSGTSSDGGRQKQAAPEVGTVEDLLSRAHAMEVEAAERYDEFAAQMELHSNLEVAALFRKLAGFERKHADSLAADFARAGFRSRPPCPWGRGERKAWRRTAASRCTIS